MKYSFSMKANSYLNLAFKSLEISKEIFNIQYLQKCNDTLNIFDISLIKEVSHFSGQCILQSWDTAISENDNSSYSVCTIWSIEKDEYVLIEFFKEKISYSDLLYHALLFANKYVLAEDLHRHNVNVQRYIPKFGKIQRAMLVSHKIEKIKIFSELLNKDVFINDMRNFPYMKSDDLVDSVTQFLHTITVNNFFIY